MNIKNSIFLEDNEEFLWDETALTTFKKNIKDQGMKCCMDDIFLLGILRARKFDIQRSLQLLKNYYTIRTSYPQYFKDLLPSKLEHALSLNCMQFLPKPDQKGRYIYICQLGNWDTTVLNLTDLFRAFMLFMDFQLNFHRTQVNSIVLIVNAEGLSLSHFLQFSPRLLNSMISIVFKDSYQLRYEELHYVNLNIIMKAILSIIIPLLPHKLKSRLHFHTDMETLHKFIKPECLPMEFGGILPTFDPTEANNMLRVNEEFFRKNEEYIEHYEISSRNVINGRFNYISEDYENDKLKEFIEKSENNFNYYYKDPEGFLNSLKEDSKCDITHF
ncbi:alpha-tocopherol transfer protein-like [Centruroides sculpturatus]|uniref:alpha-tocopherol transfer protein-like n=1 Tax=Centruroides sculpturatus TaxID=218467 RepID=UPI000C6D2EBB|nr:alpha-tocopherol transfer protein-like [Centruroides sculpturatus]